MTNPPKSSANLPPGNLPEVSRNFRFPGIPLGCRKRKNGNTQEAAPQELMPTAQ